jgi:diguanylate cyclase (GGDEF)-like protein/PAS domain S-box-containing protein
MEWELLFNTLNIGVILLDSQGRVLFWNDWVAQHSGLKFDKVSNHTLSEAFPEPLPKSFTSAIDRTFSSQLPCVLSTALHQSPLPLFNLNGSGERIAQALVLNPVKQPQGELACLIQIIDSSTSLKREKMLRDHSESHKRDATIDPLTGLYNRRFFDSQYAIQLAQAQQQNTTLSLIMLDIDYFKNYNDHYGHPAGDSAIIAVANCIKSKLQRGSDLAARYGGEEFIVMLPNSTVAVAQTLAENIRLAVRELNINHMHSLISKYLTVSVGVSSCLPSVVVDKVTFLKNTDLALYAAKQKGRNQVQYLPL